MNQQNTLNGDHWPINYTLTNRYYSFSAKYQSLNHTLNRPERGLIEATR